MDLCEGLNSNQCEALKLLAEFLKENDNKYSKDTNNLINIYGAETIPLIITDYLILRDMLLNLMNDIKWL